MFDITVYTQWIKKNVTYRDVILLLLITSLFIFLRTFRLDSFPIFSDEGIYINWSYVAWKDAANRFVSLTDGRQPLQTWGTIPFLKIFTNNLLVGGRMFAVTGGLMAYAGLTTILWYLFGKRTAILGALLYTITPYFLFYERLALVDAVMNGFTLWMFFFSIVMARTRRLDVALVLGALTGFGLLAKSSVRLYAGLILFGVLFTMFSDTSRPIHHFFTKAFEKLFGKTKRWLATVNYLILYGIVMAISMLIYNVQRLSPYLHNVESKNTTFVMTLPELLQHPFQEFNSNIISIPYYIFSEMGYVIGFIGILGLFWMYKKHQQITIYLLIWIVGGAVAISFVAKVLFPRYVMSLGGLLMIPAAYALAHIKDRNKLILTFGVIILSTAFLHYTILFDHARLPFPEIDRGQYIEDWPAGWGADEIVAYAREKSQEKPVYLIAEGDFGVMGDVLRSLLRSDDQIYVKAHWPLNDEALKERQELLKEDAYVFVVYGHCKEIGYQPVLSDDQKCFEYEGRKPLKLIQKHIKPGGKASMYMFELLPESS